MPGRGQAPDRTGLPTWARVRAQIADAQSAGSASPHDDVRKAKLADLARYLKRPVVVYAVDCLTPSPKTKLLQELLGPLALLIEPGDKDAFAEVLEGIDGPALTVVIQSPGGIAETTEALVVFLRGRFELVDFIVPNYAKSAATMLALSGDRIYMDDLSELGPIDPQFPSAGGVPSPAPAILRQFEQAVDEIKKEPERLPAWAPILQQYAPALLDHAREVWELAERMVHGWLCKYMFAGRTDADALATTITAYFSGRGEHDRPGSHARPIGIEKAMDLGLEVVDLQKNPGLHRRVRELHHAVNITLSETNAYKVFENSKGQSFIRGLNLEVVAQAQAEGPQEPAADSPQQ